MAKEASDRANRLKQKQLENMKKMRQHTGIKQLVNRRKRLEDGMEIEYTVFPDDDKDNQKWVNDKLIDRFDKNIGRK